MTDLITNERRPLSLSGVGSRIVQDGSNGYRTMTCPRCASVVGVDDRTIRNAPVECCVCYLVFYPQEPQ
jgi:hypothetical protein